MMTTIMQQKETCLMDDKIRNNNKQIYKIMSNKKRHRFKVWESTIFDIETKYDPIEPLGRGAYGVVCSSINTSTNEKVAIKKISNVFDHSVGALKVLREMKILRQTRHENVIKLKDVMVASIKSTFKDVYLVYELMDCELTNVIYSPRQLSKYHIKYFMFQLLNGLNYLHSANIIHRDLKPENLLVNANCDLKISDFGLSRTTKGRAQPMTVCVGTPAYRAPELLLSCETYGTSMDMWSVGCIFAELLGRKQIFPGKDSLDQLKLILNLLGTPRDSDLKFITNSRILNFLKSQPFTPKTSLSSLFPNADFMALDLLQQMLVFNPNRRITVSEALKHPYMTGYYDSRSIRRAPFPCDIAVDADAGVNKIRDMIWDEMLLHRPETAPFR
ncbi:hypothetical protein RND81_13G183900 [Saponaria officinalis]|uniref:Mitogen-activated protein kinase n=1 Tax=Saponaria officinalis TaxID=3572 RepID=A0AAW1H201_SAPOF